MEYYTLPHNDSPLDFKISLTSTGFAVRAYLDNDLQSTYTVSKEGRVMGPLLLGEGPQPLKSALQKAKDTAEKYFELLGGYNPILSALPKIPGTTHKQTKERYNDF